MADPLFAFILQLGIFHEGRISVASRLLLLLRDQIRSDVLRIRHTETQAGHYGHVLHLQLMAVIGTLAVLQIKQIWQVMLRVILRPDVFLLIRAIRPRALPGIVNPAHQIIVVGLLADTREVRRECATFHLAAFSN